MRMLFEGSSQFMNVLLLLLLLLLLLARSAIWLTHIAGGIFRVKGGKIASRGRTGDSRGGSIGWMETTGSIMALTRHFRVLVTVG